ncbi:MAG: hypothetical protein OJF60_001870 [Burkholderiaceae bacterium]|nr:MAG: hypothetical protein OJF60_001870 [Burkholderiaceae bacterium]
MRGTSGATCSAGGIGPPSDNGYRLKPRLSLAGRTSPDDQPQEFPNVRLQR